MPPPPNQYTQTVPFSVVHYRNIILPDPIVFEDFDAVPEGSLPVGWTEENYSDLTNWDEDLANLDSASFARWIVIDADRFHGDFIAAPISQDLAPYISARIDDDPVQSKRVELFRLPAADRQPTVRFRFAHAGNDSWYFGVDNFGLYSIPAPVEPPALFIQREGQNVVISWPAEADDFTLEQTSSLTQPVWSDTPGVNGTSVTIPTDNATMFYRLRH